MGPQPAELVIVGDAFGFWELTDRAGVSKLETIAAQHPARSASSARPASG